jgi:SAM-dependent methyltransferase
MTASELVDYYARRAHEYERIYDKPERQADLAILKEWIQNETADRDVLEIACGTGYWTHVCAPRAKSILAVDMAEETLEIAQAKEYPFGKVRFGKADAYHLEPVPGTFTAGLACFWWSHIPHEQLMSFLESWHRKLGLGARVIFLDNRYADGSSTPISRTDEAGNTYQLRRLDDGSEHEVLKNFPSAAELLDRIKPCSGDAKVLELPYYWGLTYTLDRAQP